jgi:hypothetical protein
VAAQPHPVRLVVTDDLRRSRLTTFFRILLAIPHLIWVLLYSIGAFFAALANWFATLATGRSPRGLHDFLAGYVRYATYLSTYLHMAANPYPPFTALTDEHYPIDVEIDPPAHQHRLITLFRVVLILPAWGLAYVLGSGLWKMGNETYSIAGLVGILCWVVALALGRVPRGLRDLLAWATGYTAQTWAYFLLLTDRYPSTDPLQHLASVTPPDAPGRARLVNADDLQRSRLSVFFRLLLAVPHIVWLYLWSIAALLAALATWFVTLLTGRPAAALARFLSAYVRYTAHVNAFLFGIANPFPGFVGAAGSYPVDVTIPAPTQQARLLTLFRIFLALPALAISSILGYVLFLVGAYAWWVSLARGRLTIGLQRAGAFAIGYQAQVASYLFLLTDRYPHSSPLAVFEQK